MSASLDKRRRVEALASELYVGKGEYLLRIARANSRSPDDAEEALQDAFIAFIRKFDPDGEAPPLAWLTLALKRECWGRIRSPHMQRSVGQERHAELDEVGFVVDNFEHPGASPHDAAELGERVVETRDLLAQLKPQERRAIGLKALGYSYKEIGEITGWTFTKINRCIAEGNARLRELGAPMHKQH
ncbi:MAG: RNA polymerase sigma factor [Solirubrobacterales bacterium]